jgi:ABC-2 type transport system ATP-binding protein
MRQRIGLAQALINDPELVIISTSRRSGLDPLGTHLDERSDPPACAIRGKTVIDVFSHRLDDVQDVCDRDRDPFQRAGPAGTRRWCDKLRGGRATCRSCEATNLRLNENRSSKNSKTFIPKHGGKLESFGHPTTTLEDLFKKVVEESKARPGRRYLPAATDGKA